ncbi:aldehyde dehydrogenase family protein [Jeotgalicoccus sp. S0W5]|uniref:aldehyde dehydrogenase family protein n=1 Tax=Jeotgalicoccus sp. S0W5 TaxID=2527874 RepID=UPI001414F2D7|nr:aldehyde dehydrogenase family protein [Jeotgalicoccus sp. S0W5]
MTQINLSPETKEFLKETVPLFINGEFVKSESGKTFDSINPADGEVLATIFEAGKNDIDKAVKAARAAFESPEWSEISTLERGNLMFRLSQLIEENKQIIAELDSLDNGKPIKELLENDIPNAIGQFQYFGGWTTKNTGQTIPVSSASFNYTKHEPVGVAGQIIPWNFPFMMAAWKLAPALATGCTAILKPAEQTPLSAIYLAKLIKEAGFPNGVVNIVPGFGSEAGNSLVEHEDVDKIAFTGSTAVGQTIMKKAADSMKRVTLELGGKSPNIILPDADLEKAIPGAFAAIMANQGEVCSAGSRLYVHKDIYDEVLSKLSDYAKKVKQGHGLADDTEMGPLVSKKQQDRVKDYIQQGINDGATLLTGGSHSEKGYFVEPTIFTDVTDDMSIVKEEIFGPVLVAQKFETLDEAIMKANDSPYGLGAGVWTESNKNAHYMADRIKSGSVWVNCYNLTNPAIPFGGYKKSGFGREMGSYALENYTEVKSVWMDLS